MHRLNSIDEILSHQLKIKKARAEIQFQSISNLERPREVYLKTCLTIANYFERYGFKYLKSSAELVQETNDKSLKFKIRFQSDYSNIAGVYVGLSVTVFIESIGLKKWQKQHAIPGQTPWAMIYVGDISKFSQTKHLLFQWNIADNNEREIAIIEIIDLIENDVLPTFELFKDVELICSLIIEGDFVSYDPLINIQYLLFNKSRTETITAIKNYLQKGESRMEQYLIDNEKIKKDGLPQKMFSYSHNIALFTNYYQLGDIA